MIRSRKVIVISAALALCAAWGAQAGTPDRIAKFVTTTGVGNSALFERSGRIGLGTTAPVSSFDIRSQNALNLWATRPYLTFRDSATTNSLSRIQGSDGGITFSGQSAINHSNPSALVRVDKEGRLGIGTTAPQRALQIGGSVDAMFTLEPSPGSPMAGYIRFGDNTGWYLSIARSRNSSGGPLNTGNQGNLVTIKDNGDLRVLQGSLSQSLWIIADKPVCYTSNGTIGQCGASSLRYKSGVAPYNDGLDVINRLQPISFTRIINGRREIGFGAEDVEKVEPRLTYPNEKGEVEGVRYELLTTVLVNAIKEQQETIEALRSDVTRLENVVQQLVADQEVGQP
jgi:hypothetical protein